MHIELSDVFPGDGAVPEDTEGIQAPAPRVQTSLLSLY